MNRYNGQRKGAPMTVAHINTIKMTADQYFQLGEDPPGTRLELIDGEIIVSPSPSRKHADIVFTLAYILEGHLRKHSLGKLYLDTDVIFDSGMVRRPDIAYFSSAKLAAMSNDILDESPDLCIEVLSPGNIDDDRINKFNLYQSHNVSHYWIIDPDARTAEAYALTNGKYTLVASAQSSDTAHFPPFASLNLPLADLWMPRT